VNQGHFAEEAAAAEHTERNVGITDALGDHDFAALHDAHVAVLNLLRER
jgi:hypothetical protein